MALERPVTSQPEYGERLADIAYWAPYIKEALRRVGLPTDSIAAPPAVGTFPTFLAGDVVVKFFGETFDGPRSAATELAMHELLGAHSAVRVPSVVGHGTLFDPDGGWRWPYLVTERLHGVAIRELISPATALEPVAEQLGRAVNCLHQLEPPTVVADRDLLPELRASARSRLAEFGMPAELVEQVDDYLQDASNNRVLVHADITADHAFIDDARLEGIIDWGDAIVADPYYELVAIYFDCLRGNRALFDRFVVAAEWPMDSTFPRHALQAVLEFQFDALRPIRQLVDLGDVRNLDDLAGRLFG